MEIKLVTGATTYEACVNTIKQIDYSDLDMTNLVVVPDSFSMQAENLIFEVLDTQSVFNIEVVGISRLASKILRNNNVAFERISGLEEIFCIFKVIKENENKFKYFHKCGVDYCVKILQVVKQFKACKIKPSQIKPVGDELLDRKMGDLRLIYEEYEKTLGEKMDLSKLLDFFVTNENISQNLSKINLFFVNFDSFSLEINSFICCLAQKVNKVYIGMARPISARNSFIYENDILNKTTKLAKENNLLVTVENFATSLENEHLKMAKNLFGFQVEKGESNFFTNIIAKNKQDEVEFVAKYIKNKVFHGARFKDFSVAVANEAYLDLIKMAFAEYNIPVYCDDAVDLSQTVLGRYVLKMLEISKLGFDAAALQYLLTFPFKELAEQERKLKDIFYFNIEDEDEFIERYPEHENLIKKIKMLKKCKKISDFSTILKELINFVDFDAVLNILSDEKLHKIESENSQASELLEKVFDKLSELGGEQQLDIFDFERLLILALKTVKVETIPSYIDAVYVGDATTSYFEDVNTLFVLGATANALPRNQNDTGIIDDEDIKKLKLEFALEPEIKVLNRRSRLKIFEMLQHAKEKLIVCTPISEDGKLSQRAGFVTDLYEMFGANVVHTISLEDFDLAILNEEQVIDKLLFYIGTNTNALNAYSKLKGEGKLPKKYAGSLNCLIKNFIRADKLFVLTNVAPLSKTVYSASELESYFSCPFKHFVSYNLKIKANENIEPNKRLFGIFEHELLKNFIENFEENSKNIEKFLKENVEKIAAKTYDEKILKRKQFLTYLKDQSKILIKNMINERKNSDFEPIFLEKRVLSNLFNDKNLVGYIDRVDKAGNYFRIIDYKTGKTDGVRKDLFYGKKLQLFLYANAIQKQTGLTCAGVYYFDCQTKYQKGNQKVTLLKGLTRKEDEVVMLTDKRLWQDEFRSDLIGMTRKKNEKEEFSFKNGAPADDLEKMIDYSVKISKLATEEIEQGYILPKPCKDECQKCPYLSICKYEKLNGFRTMQTVKSFKRETDEN